MTLRPIQSTQPALPRPAPASTFTGTLSYGTDFPGGLHLQTSSGNFEVVAANPEVQAILDSVRPPNDVFLAEIQGRLVQGFEGMVLEATSVKLVGQP
jgi:hypothetical protein